jgi:AcrR family transcriptional regulator
MGSVATPRLDRRLRRRQETIEEVLDLAAQIMAEQGVAGLALGEIARRLGIQPPSLYEYFPSKHALYDALFARGARRLLDVMREIDDGPHEVPSLHAALLAASERFVRWSIEHAPYSQLLFWRPVPGYVPSAEAYAPAEELLDWSRRRLAGLQERRLIRADVSTEQVLRDWTVVISGVISQQLSNAPDEDFDSGRFTVALPGLVAMFANYYAPRDTSTSRVKRSIRRGNQS